MSGSKSRNAQAFAAVKALLAQLRPREDAAALTRKLQAHFGSADALFRANPKLLEELGVHPSDALLLSRLPELSRLTRSARSAKRPLLGRLCDASDYIVSCFHGLQVERFCLFCLDANGRLKRETTLQEGNSNSAIFDLPSILAEAVQCQANAVIVAHNHPGASLAPSDNDINCTRSAIDALSAIGIPLLDHVIVAGQRLVSIRQSGLIFAPQWLQQDPNHRLLCGWLEGAQEM